MCVCSLDLLDPAPGLWIGLIARMSWLGTWEVSALQLAVQQAFHDPGQTATEIATFKNCNIIVAEMELAVTSLKVLPRKRTCR